MPDETDYLEAYDNVLMQYQPYLKMIQLHADILSNIEGKLILDCGCGTGNFSVELLNRGYIVTAVDKNVTALEMLKNKVKNNKNLTTLTLNLEEKLPFDYKTFNAVNSAFVLHLISNPKSYFKQIYNVLKNNGVFVFTERIFNENAESLLDLQEEHLRSKGLLLELQEYIDILKNRLLYEVNDIMSYNYSREKVESLLLNAGFREVHEFENPYPAQYHSFLAEK